MDEICRVLQSCGTLVELMKASSELKQKGYDVLSVNNEFTKCRKALLKRLSEVKRIHTEPLTEMSLEMNAVIPINVTQLGKPVITVTNGMSLI